MYNCVNSFGDESNLQQLVSNQYKIFASYGFHQGQLMTQLNATVLGSPGKPPHSPDFLCQMSEANWSSIF